jgi:serine/threonine protein kinase
MMPLKEGNLKNLVEKYPGEDFSGMVLDQMLLALKCLAEHEMIHRDVKPENILWEYNKKHRYHFRLGDFGLSHNPKVARTVAGTEPFMAPEILNRKKQTEKVDIWSLFATIVWVRNVDGFRQSCSLQSPAEVHSWLVEIAQLEDFRLIRSMARLKPSQRPTAKELIEYLALPHPQEDDEIATIAQEKLRLDDDPEEGRPDPGIGSSRLPYTARPMPIPIPVTVEEEEEEDDGVEHVPYFEPYPPNMNYGWLAHEVAGSPPYAPPPPGFETRRGGGRNQEPVSLAALSIRESP